MKMSDGLYFCPWCCIEFKAQTNRIEGNGRKGVGVASAICPECTRTVSQKTKIETETKIERGFKI